MHPLLDTEDRQLACRELIQALEDCHAKGLLYKMSMGCNEAKDRLSVCLRKERIDRTTRNREASKEKNKKKYDAWERWDRAN